MQLTDMKVQLPTNRTHPETQAPLTDYQAQLYDAGRSSEFKTLVNQLDKIVVAARLHAARKGVVQFLSSMGMHGDTAPTIGSWGNSPLNMDTSKGKEFNLELDRFIKAILEKYDASVIYNMIISDEVIGEAGEIEENELRYMRDMKQYVEDIVRSNYGVSSASEDSMNYVWQGNDNGFVFVENNQEYPDTGLAKFQEDMLKRYGGQGPVLKTSQDYISPELPSLDKNETHYPHNPSEIYRDPKYRHNPSKKYK